MFDAAPYDVVAVLKSHEFLESTTQERILFTSDEQIAFAPLEIPENLVERMGCIRHENNFIAVCSDDLSYSFPVGK